MRTCFFEVRRFTKEDEWLVPAVRGVMGVPQHAGVVHHDDERPHVLPLDALLLLAVPLQLQVVVGQLFDHEAGSTFTYTEALCLASSITVYQCF